MCRVIVECCCRGGGGGGLVLVGGAVLVGAAVIPPALAALTAFLVALLWWAAVVAGTAVGATALLWGARRALIAHADRRDALEAAPARPRLQATISDVRVIPTSRDRIERERSC